MAHAEFTSRTGPRSEKMRGIYTLRQVFRIHLRVHYTWLFAAVLLTAAIVTQFSTVYPLWQRLILGAAGTVLFFVVIVTREFILAVTSARKGMTINVITLFVFGGLHQVEKDTTIPDLELLQSALGQLFNLLTAGIFTAVYFLLVHTGNIIVDVLMQWLAFIWFMLAILHFVPGFPLDGGRALRALIWRLTGNYEKATRTAGWIGWTIGLLASMGGITLLVLAQEWFTGVLLVAVGLVLQNAATHGRRLAAQTGALTGEQQSAR